MGSIPPTATPDMGQGMPTSPSPVASWTIRPYQTGDEQALIQLFQQVFGRTITLEYWRWKLKQRTSPVENVWLAEHEKQPIFQYAGIPIQIRLPEGSQTVMVAVDGMTAPAFRRQGVLTAGVQHAHTIWRQAGIPFVLGLPNEQWGSRIAALGWEKLFPLQWLIRPLRPETTLARRLRYAPLSQYTLLSRAWNRLWDLKASAQVHIRPLQRAGHECDAVWHYCQAEAEITIIRNSAWGNWRYFDPPGLNYQMLLAERAGQPQGYVVYRVQKNALNTFGFIAELLARKSDTDVWRALIQQAIQRLQTAGVEAVATLAVPHTWLYRVFRQAGFVFSWGSFDVSLVPLQPSLPLPSLRNPQNWHLSGGDFDVL